MNRSGSAGGDEGYTVEEIARAIGGRVVGNGRAEVRSVSPIEDARPGSAVFVKNRRNFAFVAGRRGPLCVVVGFEPTPENPGGENAAGTGPGPGAGPGGPFDFVVVDERRVDSAFIGLLTLFERKDLSPSAVSPKASISPTATLGAGVRIDDFASVGERTTVGDGTSIGTHVSIGRDCAVGKGCVIYPNVTIYPDTILEDGVILHAGTVIGGDGFGYKSIDGVNRKIPQIGGVRIERNVEIGANTTVDRATIGYTVIGENTKIDNLVQIGHNTVIGKNTIICGLCGISGSVKIGDNVIVAGAAGIADHVVIEDGVFIGAKAGVMERNVVKGSKLLGTPAINFKTEMEFAAVKPKIRGMFFDLKKIKETLGL